MKVAVWICNGCRRRRRTTVNVASIPQCHGDMRLLAGLLTQRDAAAYVEMDPKTFRAECAAGHGPATFRASIRTNVRYDTDRLDEWMHSRDDRKAAS